MRTPIWNGPDRLVLLGVLAVVGTALLASMGLAPGGLRLAAADKPDFVVGIAPPTRTVAKSAAPQQVTYAISLQPEFGFTGSASLSVSGLPSGVTGSFSPPVVSETSGSTLTLTISPSAAASKTAFTVTGVSGKDTNHARGELVVATPPSSGYTLRVSPSSVQASAGSSAVYYLSVIRAPSFTSAVTFTALGLPSGAGIVPVFSPASTTGSSATLTLATNIATTPDDAYPFTIQSQGGAFTRTAGATLVVKTLPGKSFEISGGIQGDALLSLGQDRPVALTFDNPNNQDIAIQNVSVSVSHTSAGAQCTASDFTVTPFSGAYPIVVPRHATRSLADLGIAVASWPTVRIEDLPTDQNGCKDVTVHFTFTGYATSAQGTTS